MHFLVAPNILRADAVRCAQDMCAQLRAAGHTPMVLPEAAALPGWQELPVWAGQPVPDMLLFAGGDGTLLRCLREMGRWDVPVWGVNCGHMGYLTACEPADAQRQLGAILAGEYTLEERILLKGQVVGAGGEEKAAFTALNEANIYRGAMARALRLQVAVRGRLVRRLTADGLIVCTPTGSTAYNFSAGGPILLPSMDCFAITPVCPYAALSSAIVTSGEDSIHVQVALPQGEDAGTPLLVVDGCERIALADGDEVRLQRAAVRLRTVQTCRQDFYARLQDKLAQG